MNGDEKEMSPADEKVPHPRHPRVGAKKLYYLPPQCPADVAASAEKVIATSQPDLLLLPDDLLVRMVSFLDAASFLQLRMVHPTFCRICGWKVQCQALWRHKIHVCPQAVALLATAAEEEEEESAIIASKSSHSHAEINHHKRPIALQAYRMSLVDATNRQHVHLSELLYNPDTLQGTVWSFRFKQSAGDDWTSVDPWYQNLPAKQFVFLDDGLVQQYHASSSTLSASPPPYLSTTNTSMITLSDPPTRMTWRFLQSRPMDLPTRHRPTGSYVRLTVGGRDVPTYVVRRSPTGNWGMIMESCWGLFASFELPARKKTTKESESNSQTLVGNSFARPIRRRTTKRPRRTLEGSISWVEEGEDDSDEEDEDSHRPSLATTSNLDAAQLQEAQGIRELQDDSALLITNDIQWREAFLYNVGARILPEGEEASEEFDRAWGAL
jgi:hypothetical protein